MSDSPFERDDPPGAADEDERLLDDVGDVPGADRDRDEAPGIEGPEHLGLTPPG